MAARIASVFFSVLSLVAAVTTFHHAYAANQGNSQSLWVTMHTTTIDNYCAPCIASERLLKDSRVEFTKVLEPLGPWPWFQLTDNQGNQKRIEGMLTQEDIDAIKRGEFPERD